MILEVFYLYLKHGTKKIQICSIVVICMNLKLEKDKTIYKFTFKIFKFNSKLP